MTNELKGVFSPVVTPFGRDLSINPGPYVDHCRWLLSQNCGLAVFGTNSEANSLSVSERKALLETLVENGLPPSRMMPGTGCCSLTESVELTSHAVRLGAAGVLMLPPFYYKGISDEGLFRYYSEVIQRVGAEQLRVYLYHIPPVAQVPITLGLIERLLRSYPSTVVGIKDSSGDWSNTKAMLDAFPGFGVFAGSETFLLKVMRNGGVGCISATANINPARIHELYLNWQSPQAETLQTELDLVRAAHAKYPMISALKATIEAFSGESTWSKLRPPLTELSKLDARALALKLRDLRFEMPGLSITRNRT